jgi:hypothetical protein
MDGDQVRSSAIRSWLPARTLPACHAAGVAGGELDGRGRREEVMRSSVAGGDTCA